MKHQRLMGIAGTVIRSSPLKGLGLCAAGALAIAAPVHAPRHRVRDAFTLTASPRASSVAAGGTVRYRIVMRPGRYRGRIRLRLASVRPGLLSRRGNTVRLRTRGRRAVLIIHTAAFDPLRRYRLRITAIGGHHRARVTLALTLTRPRPVPFRISGNFGSLWPGTSRLLDLSLTNPNAYGISIRSLSVAIRQISAPRATRSLPCSPADFSLTQFAGAYPLKLSAHATVDLTGLGVPPGAGPQLQMLNRPVNQDGCQGATVNLAYSGMATSG